ncbi:hypothetical protein M514_07599 [Trichuris suis]|uniref:GRIP domain-containing protein n=1 Tax=Trichuris suis TaxID=68888 RepID=A0A085NCP0_9BILA|nr:hypothetical protein M514_07599 [Trichuris suis]
MTKAEMLENKCNELTACKEGMEEKSERLISEALQAANEQAQKELQSTIDDMSQRNLSKMAELRDMAQKWKSEATSLQDRLNNQDAELDEYNRAMEQWANERSTIDQQMKHLQEELEDEKKKAASFEEQLKKAESDRVHIASELTNASKEVECLRLEKNTLCLEHEQLMEKSKATFEALQKANGYIESLEAMDQSERNVTAAFTLLANLSQGYLSLLDKTATCIPDMEELVTDKSDISVDKHAAESVDSSHGLEDSLEKCRLQLTRFADLLARGDKPLDDLVNESALVGEVVTVVMESIDRLIKTCRLRSEAIKELRDSTNILLKEKESLKSEIDTFGPIKASCERSWSSFKASLSRLTPPTEDKLSVSPLLERDHILSRLEQVAAKCDEASVNYDFSAPFDSLVSMMQWLLETGDLRWQSHQASIGILDKKYHLLEKRFEEKINECNRLSDLRLSEEEAKVSRQKDAAAFFAEMETIFEELSSQMCQMNIPVLEASLECLGGLVLVCSQLKRLDEPLLRKEEFLNGVRLAYGSMLSSLESEATKLNKELSNSKENMRTIDILKAQLVSNDSQTQMLRVALQRLFDSVAHEFDQIQCRLCKFESAIGDSLSSLSQLDSALQQRHSLNEKLTSLRARNENLEAEVASKQKELELLRRTSVWSDWEQDELAASVHGSSPREPPDVETNAHRVPDDTHERDKVKQVEVAKVELPSLECAPLAEALNGTLSSHDVKNSLSGQDTRSELSNRDYPTHLDQFAMRSEQTGHSAQERKRFDSVDFHPLFAEPTEAEYLKNILYRYMTERELLGRESVTLAKAIAAVVKFSPSQTRLVLLKEESRSAASW